jgi:peptidoglycan hydrolase CwlO-like protein
MINLRKPQINAPTTAGQVQQLKSFLYTFIDDIQYQFGQYEKRIDELEKELKETKKNIGGTK